MKNKEDEDLRLEKYEDEDGIHTRRFFPSGKLKDTIHGPVSQSYREKLKPEQKICKEEEERIQIGLLGTTQQRVEGLKTILDTYNIANKHKKTIQAEIVKCKKQMDDIKKKLK